MNQIGADLARSNTKSLAPFITLSWGTSQLHPLALFLFKFALGSKSQYLLQKETLYVSGDVNEMLNRKPRVT